MDKKLLFKINHQKEISLTKNILIVIGIILFELVVTKKW